MQARDEFNATTDGNFSVLLLDLDDTVPVLFLVGSSSITLEVGSLFHDQNATWTDNIDGNGTVTGSGSVNPNMPSVVMYCITITPTQAVMRQARHTDRHGGGYNCPCAYHNR